MTPAHLTLAAAAAALLLCARADTLRNAALSNSTARNNREVRVYGKVEHANSCLYDGRWHEDGATVTTREECLRCVCVRGALSCRRRACAPLPDPLPRRCHVRHRRGSCCPELHCPDGVKLMEHGAAARFESDDSSPEPEDIVTPTAANHACVEGGSVFAAGSALASSVACEQCFCLRGAKRCVRPRCLPPPPHCAPRPAPGACCPQRYYCDRTVDDHDSDTHRRDYDCKVNGTWVAEGDSVSAEDNCTACFCLRGAVRCQALGCAPPLAGCRPLLALGDCCAHQYICDHSPPEALLYRLRFPENSLHRTRYDERAFHSSKTSKIESTTKKIITNGYTLKHTPNALATKNHLITTTKVKRKTEEPSLSSSQTPELNINSTSNNVTSTHNPFSVIGLITEPDKTSNTDATREKTTEQPDGTIKIVINGTINCTAELSSTSLPLSITLNDTDKAQLEVLPRVPTVNVEAQTYSPNDIITDRNVNGGFEENDTFTINVTSSLVTNTSHSTFRPAMTISKAPMPADQVDALNSSKKTKGDYDFDYTEPTLPPSLPNLKIIPFVAADAVVDNEPAKETLTFPILEREDKFPVYYPNSDTKDAVYPKRREDTYQPTQYPIYISAKVDSSYAPISHNVDLNSNRYPKPNELGVHEYTVSTSLGRHKSDVKPVTAGPTTTFAVETPAVNRFSPPLETEGGFIPKGPGIVEEYYAVYPSTPAGPAVPHLTTSMQLDMIAKSKCRTSDGRDVLEGESVTLGCVTCTCTWVELSCVPRACAPPACQRDACADTITTSTLAPAKEENKAQVKKNETHKQVIPLNNNTDVAKTNKVNIEKATANNITINNVTNPPIQKTESVATTTTVAPTVTAQPIPEPTTSTVRAPTKVANDSSQEYDDDEEEEFSFGSVLKLLLSDTYETTTSAPVKKSTTKPLTRPPPPPPPPPTSPLRPSTVAPFIPLPPSTYLPAKTSPNSVNRIDHLVLGEATAIKRTTMRPITNKTTKRPIQHTTTERKPDNDEPIPFTSVAHEGPRPPNLGGLPGVGAGLLKLAGCNIYGRMYRVGRIIAELSTPCQECWCTELGVQCKPLYC